MTTPLVTALAVGPIDETSSQKSPIFGASLEQRHGALETQMKQTDSHPAV
jgi:hypothetical protein